MRVVGICRFSYPALGGFKRMHDTIAAREAYLYAAPRMDLRFRHFETLTLPSIRAQKDPDFTFLVLVGDSLPKPYLERLHDITANVPQIKIIAKEPMKHRLAMQIAIKEELGDDKEESIQFRLDDDDAVAINFVRSTRWFGRHTAPMRKRWKNMAFEYNTGFSVSLSADGIKAEEVQSPFWACGLAVLFKPGDRKTVMNYAHHRLHTHMPTMINPHPYMYLRSKHEDNDSEAAYKTGVLKPLDAAQRTLLKARFDVDEEHVKRVFGAPAVPLASA
ncbi:MAG: glycosyltransferase [Roseovarius sp.]